MVSILLYRCATYSQKEKFPKSHDLNGLIDKNPGKNATRLLYKFVIRLYAFEGKNIRIMTLCTWSSILQVHWDPDCTFHAGRHGLLLPGRHGGLRPQPQGEGGQGQGLSPRPSTSSSCRLHYCLMKEWEFVLKILEIFWDLKYIFLVFSLKEK